MSQRRAPSLCSIPSPLATLCKGSRALPPQGSEPGAGASGAGSEAPAPGQVPAQNTRAPTPHGLPEESFYFVKLDIFLVTVFRLTSDILTREDLENTEGMTKKFLKNQSHTIQK